MTYASNEIVIGRRERSRYWLTVTFWTMLRCPTFDWPRSIIDEGRRYFIPAMRPALWVTT